MLSSTIRTLVTGKASVGLATLALLGGGAALAAPDGTPAEDVLAAVSTPLADVPPASPADTPVDPDVPEPETPLGETPPVDVPERPDLGPNQSPDVAVDPPSTEASVAQDEDDSPGWALGRADDDQQKRVEDFCTARAEAAAANASGEGEGIPPFCTTGPQGTTVVPPNEFGRTIADAARDGEFAEDDEGVGPPPGAGRPDGVPGEDAEGERVGPPEGVPTEPPADVPGRGPRSDS